MSAEFGCTCRTIMEADHTRHFRGCALREKYPDHPAAQSIVRVGVAVVFRMNDRVLMGLRKGSHGAGTWSFPGGHLEPGESVFECASRELREETGIARDPDHCFRKLTYTNDVFVSEGKHYVTLYVETDFNDDTPWPEVMEPEKCGGWKFWNEPPSPLFLPIENLLKDGFLIWRREP